MYRHIYMHTCIYNIHTSFGNAQQYRAHRSTYTQAQEPVAFSDSGSRRANRLIIARIVVHFIDRTTKGGLNTFPFFVSCWAV